MRFITSSIFNFMKKDIITFLCIFILINSSAQDPSYTGAAKIYVKSFWNNVNNLKEGKGGSVQNLERQLATTKEKDPAYNTTAMEAELKVWKEKHEQAEAEKKAGEQKKKDQHQAQQDGAWQKINDEKLLQTVLDGTVMQVGHNNLPYVKQAMEDYKKQADAVLMMDLAKYSAKIADIKRYVDRSGVNTIQQFIEKTKGLIKEVKNPDDFEPAFYELRYRQMHWDVLRKVYSGDASYQKYYQDITALISQIGSMDAIKKTATQNDAAAIKGTKLAAPVLKDATLEKIFINGFNKKYGSVYNGTAIKVILLQDGWTIERHNISGVVTGRNRIAELAYKGNDGKCYVMPQPVYIYQPNTGGASYGASEVIYNGFSGQEMLCENVK